MTPKLPSFRKPSKRPAPNLWIILSVLASAVVAAPAARADFAVLKSGVRLHITGYETAGDRVRLTMSGKFLPYKYYGATGNAPGYGYKEE